jgi:folate-binding protein YgfZ
MATRRIIIHLMNANLTHTPPNGVCPLPHLGVIRAQGEEAAKFLHGQLTQDFSLLGLSEARLAGFCSAKGRLLASFVGFKRSHDEVLLITERDLLTPTLKRLQMFVLRAKAKLTDASDDFALMGLCGEAVPANLPSTPWQQVRDGDAQLVRLYPGAATARALWLAPTGTPAPAGPALSADEWRWLEVQSAIAPVMAATADAFVPQMLNYESVGGVNFKKGCYPGQEVVARSQFRGTLKRRAFVLHSAEPLAAGQEVFHSADAEQACGTVALAAPAPSGGWDALASLTIASTHSGSLHAGAASGPALRLGTLPYALLDDI